MDGAALFEIRLLSHNFWIGPKWELMEFVVVRTVARRSAGLVVFHPKQFCMNSASVFFYVGCILSVLTLFYIHIVYSFCSWITTFNKVVCDTQMYYYQPVSQVWYFSMYQLIRVRVWIFRRWSWGGMHGFPREFRSARSFICAWTRCMQFMRVLSLGAAMV